MSHSSKTEILREEELIAMNKGIAKVRESLRQYRLKRLRLDINRQKKLNKHAEKLFVKLNDLMAMKIKQSNEIDDLFELLEALF